MENFYGVWRQEGMAISMGFTSFNFLSSYAVLLLLYYIMPKKIQWGFLLIASLGYFAIAAKAPWLLWYPLGTITIVYLGAIFIDRVKEQKKRKIVLSLVVVLAIGVLALLKYFNIQDGMARFLVPLGISFYTFTLLGYLFDVYYEIGKVEHNYLKIALFGCYFPTIISGPIMKYRDVKDTMFVKHSLNYKEITFGLQRILFGLFKILVISERLVIIVNSIFGNYKEYNGLFIALGGICFVIQLYANFSGSMDIALGISQTFGVKLPENFRTPFFATSISEFWRRWHITLGIWLKDYLFYPLLRTKIWSTLQKKLKARFGKKKAKKISIYLAMFILWFTIGLWHGGDWKYIVGSGLLQWFYIVGGEVCEPIWVKLRAITCINCKNRGFVWFQRVRTLLLFSFSMIFFRAESFSQGCLMVKQLFLGWGSKGTATVQDLGLDWIELVITVISLLILFTISSLQEKGSVRERLASQPVAIRWIILYGAIFYVILLGNYGPGFSASEFIYQLF